MLTNAFSKIMMAQDPWFLKEDGYLNVNTELSFIIHHPNLNVILVCTKSGKVTVIDVNSGDILQTTVISDKECLNVGGRYLSGTDKILFWNDLGIGLRSDYNGVLLLSTILQIPTSDSKKNVKLELLLSEAILLRQSLKGLILPSNGQWADFVNMLDHKINAAKSLSKKGIKVQKWNTVELNMHLGVLQSIVSALHSDMKSSEQCTPGMAIVASLHERLLTLSNGSAWSTSSESTIASTPIGTQQIDTFLEQQCPSGSGQQNEDPDRANMFSEAARRKTFEKWPHMDYKWALPDQMAQAGFYYKPTSVGDDRAMCFTCSVCLVCWDRTDEPWSEHERHSPGCPFVKGEYTQNVPIAVSYATGTAACYSGIQVISAGEHPEIVCTSKSDDEITVWSVNRDLEKHLSFRITPEVLNLKDSSIEAISVNALAILLSSDDGQNIKKIPTGSSSVVHQQLKESTQIICGVSAQNCSYLVQYEYITTSDTDRTNIDDGSIPATGGGARKANSNIQNLKDEVVVMYVDDNGHIPHQLGLKKKKKKLKEKQTILTAFHFANDQDHQGSELFGIPENPDDDTGVDQISYEYFVDTPLYEKNQSSSGTAKFHDESSNNMIHPSNILAKLLFKNDLHPDGLEALISKYMKVKGDKADSSITIHTTKQPLVMNYENNDSCLTYQTDATDFSSLNGYASVSKMSESKSDSMGDKNAGQSDDSNNIVADSEILNLRESTNCCKSVKFISLTTVLSYGKNKKITQILPSRDGKCIVVILKSKQTSTVEEMEVDDLNSSPVCQAVVYSIADNSHEIFQLLCARTFTSDEFPIEINVIPARRRQSGLLLITSADGLIRLIDIQSLSTITTSSVNDGKYVSATYCSGLSRICAATDQGLLRFYGLSGEELDEDEEEDLDLTVNSVTAIDSSESNLIMQTSENSEMPKVVTTEAISSRNAVIELNETSNKTQMKTPSPSKIISSTFNKQELLANKKILLVSDLRALHKLSLFDEACSPYCATVPACWCRLVQAQKQRRQPHRARSEDGQHAYAWRLQNDATTWDEHIFEITLPYSCNLGHVDLKFSLHSPCNMAPNIQVTLLKQIAGIGHHGKTDLTDRPDTRTCSNISSSTDDDSNPVLTSEYLRAQHAELLAGPVHLVSGLDLSGQGGVVTLTSPALMKYKSRTLLIHVKTMFHPVQQEQEIITKDGINFFGNMSSSSQRSSEATHGCSKGQNYLGCDWLHEVSISVRCSKPVSIPHGRLQRCSMLESDMLLKKLLQIATMSASNPGVDGVIKTANTRLVRSLALDTISWLVNVRMIRSRLPDAGRRQADCARIVQNALEGLINVSLLSCGRSEARKCVKMLLVCSNGVSDLPPDSPIIPFDQSLLRVLLRSIHSGLPNVKSASALRWFCLLLIRFASAENRGPLAVVERCLRLLRKAAIERSKRRCPYTDLLKARFGLNGMPFDSDVFDGELPHQIQQRNLDSVLGNRKPKAVSDLADMTAKPTSTSKSLRGLAEVQPLHFVCHSASEGTKLERLQQSSSSINFDSTNNILFKQFDCQFDNPKDAVTEDLLETSATMNCKLGKLLLSVEKELAKAKSTLGHKDIDMEVSDYQPDVDAAEDMSVDAEDTKSNTFSQYLQQMSQLDTTQSWSPASQATTIGSQNTDYSQNGDDYILPWSRLLLPPHQQAIVIARMHSCARRFVVLDFGRPILLTDLAIPSCNELMSLTLDYWITNEDGESTRLVMASDIATRTLILKDLQPAPILRFLKITMIGRYGMTATSVKLSAGKYYGHSTVLEADAYCESANGSAISSAITSLERARAQLTTLNSLYEDTACRYRSACCNLRYILKPLMGLAPSLAEKCADGEDDKVTQAYQECIALQQQLNVLQSVTLRLQEFCDEQNSDQQTVKSEDYNPSSVGFSSDLDLTSASSDKLRVLCESLVVVYLRLLQKASPKVANNMARFIDQDTCSELFSTLVVHGDSAQISCCALLSTACSSRTWWGTFLAESLKTLYSSSCTQLFAKERVFLLLTHLGRRGNPRSRVLDAALLALLQLLSPIAPVHQSSTGVSQQQQSDEDELGPLSAKIDMLLLSWLLLYLSACLEDSKELNSSRWEFMSGQTNTQRSRSESERNQEKSGATRVYRRKLQKRLMHHKIQLDDLESAKKAFQASSQAFSNLSSQASNLSAKLDAALKQQENVLKKSLKLHAQKYPFKVTPLTAMDGNEVFLNNNNNNSVSGGPSSAAVGSQAENVATSNETPSTIVDISPPDPLHSLAVCRALLTLLLRFDSTCGADTFLLTCKVLAKLVVSCKPSITLGQLATTQQLQLLIRRSVWTDGRRPQWAGPWAQHATTCLLQDLVETETKKDVSSDTASGRNDGVAIAADFSTRFLDSVRACNSAPLTSLDIMSMDEPEDDANGSFVGKSQNQLPSLIESDDSELEEFLDDVMDRGRNLLRRNEQSSRIHTIPSSSVSIALDARLEGGLDSSGELMLRRLKLSALTKPITASTPSSPSTNPCDSPVNFGTPNSLTPEDHAQLMSWITWPDIYSDPVPSAATLLSPCFDALFADLHMQTGANLDALLRLWTALNDQARCKIMLSPDSLQRLVSALAWLDAIPLRAWSLGFQCLSSGVLLTDVLGGQLIPKGAAAALLDEPDFRAMLVRFLSGDGDSTCPAGPTACQAMYKCLLRLKSRCEDDSHFRNAMLRVLLRLLRPGQPVALQQGPQDAQARFVHGLLHAGYERCDLATAMTVIESIGALVASHTARCEQVRCRSVADTSTTSSAFTRPAFDASSCFGSLFASVLATGSSNDAISQQTGTKSKNEILGTASHGAGKHASTEALLVALLRLANRLVCTPLLSSVSNDMPQEPMDTSEEQTDERKAERLSSPSSITVLPTTSSQKQPLLADTVLRHSPTIARLLRSLCSKGSGLLRPSLIHTQPANMSTSNPLDGQNAEPEPRGVADALYVLLDTIVKVASDQTLVAKPLYDFLFDCVHGGGNAPRLRLTVPFLTLLQRALSSPMTVSCFASLRGISVVCEGLVKCQRGLVSEKPGCVSSVMMCLGRRDAESAKGEERLENLATMARISPMNGAAQAADALLQPAHRRARTPAWTYHFYRDESHAELLITLPSAALLREVHVQPHLTTLATCPSAIAIEISPDKKTPLTPVCPPMACSGMTLIRLQLPTPEVASRVLIRLYRPRDNPNIGLTQIRLLGCSVFNETGNYGYGIDSADEEYGYGCSSGWLSLLQQCLHVEDSAQLKTYISQAASVPGLLRACCTLLIAPSTCHKLSNNLLLKLTMEEHSLGLKIINILLRDGSEIDHACIDPTAAGGVADHVAELLGALCSTRPFGNSVIVNEEQAIAIKERVAAALGWLQQAGEASIRHESGRLPCACCVYELAAVLWSEQGSEVPHKELYSKLTTKNLLLTLHRWTRLLPAHSSLKQALDGVLCAACRLRPDLLHILLCNSGAARRDPNAASVSDDSKDGLGLTDDSKHKMGSDYETDDELFDSTPLAAQDSSQLHLDEGQLETLALVFQSKAGVKMLFNSGLLPILIESILVFSNQYKTKEQLSSLTDSYKASSSNSVPMATANGVAAILNFLAELCAEKEVSDWLGSCEGSAFWNPLLMFLCCSNDQLKTVQSSKLEAACVNFLSRVTACNTNNQKTLSTVLCQIISAQSVPSRESPYSGGVSGFTRRLILQLLLRSERILVAVQCDDNVVPKPGPATAPTLSLHPALRPRAGVQMLVMPAHAKLQDIAGFYTSLAVSPGINIPSGPVRDSRRELWECSLKSSDQSRDKRSKEAKNYASRNSKRSCTNDIASEASRKQDSALRIWHPFLSKPLPSSVTLSQLLSGLNSHGLSASSCQSAMLDLKLTTTGSNKATDEEQWLLETPNLVSPIEIFSSLAGLSLLAQRLPVVPVISHRSLSIDVSSPSHADKISSEAQDWMDLAEWVKVETGEEVYCDDVPVTVPPASGSAEDTPAGPTTPPVVTTHSNKKSGTTATSAAAQGAVSTTAIPAHALAAFALFLRLPGYAEVLLRDRLPSQCLLRLMLGVSDDGEGNDIFSLPVASILPTLPFCVLRRLLDSTPLTTDDGLLLRLNFVDVGALHLILGCLAVFTHHTSQEACNNDSAGVTRLNTNTSTSSHSQPADKGLYWAKGTGFGTGSTQQSWNVEQALARQKGEELHVTSLLQALSAFINPGDQKSDSEKAVLPPDAAELMPLLKDALKRSCLLPAVSSYLRNDSVLDMARHVPLYLAVLQLLRAFAQSNHLAMLLIPTVNTEDVTPISCLLATMKQCVDTYAMRLRSNNKATTKTTSQKSHSSSLHNMHIDEEDEDDEGLALLIPEIQATAVLVQAAVERLKSDAKHDNTNTENMSDISTEKPITLSLEQRYLQVMKQLQFDTYEMMAENNGSSSTNTSGFRFTVPYHYENSVRGMGFRCCHPGRVKRLAQEAVTLSTSLPLSYSSSVFVRCDTDRLDVMKVLITGPAETPYANGCFEFDVFFPPDYPASPMQVHLETTGRQSVRFNPNLYNDGKVCLSVLNTWHGRPEEKWNSQTSSFLQVLVSIQSLILVPEPYFNEPGYERCRGTPSGASSSREYNANIYQACVRWAMLEQLRQPCACFKDVIQTHFWMKRHEIAAQVEGWILELESQSGEKRTGRVASLSAVTLKRYYKLLREELAKLPVPEGMSELDQPPFSADTSPTTPTAPQLRQLLNTSSPNQQIINDPWASGVTYHQALSSQPDIVQDTLTTEATDTDIEMEKIVSDVLCE